MASVKIVTTDLLDRDFVVAVLNADCDSVKPSHGVIPSDFLSCTEMLGLRVIRDRHDRGT